MLRLAASLAAWNSPSFAAVLKRELEQAGGAQLPLQRGLSATSVALDDAIEVMVLGVGETPARLEVRIGVFFAGIVAGCSCADDPTPVEPQNEYCELLLTIDKATAEAVATVAAD
jgi:hypothetical protein